MTTYGFWLPNDPRGSWSDFVRAWELYKFGPATKIDTHRSVAAAPHDRARRLAAKQALARPPVIFNGLQARAVGRGLARRDYIIHACSILPDHVHMVLAAGRLSIETMAEQLKGCASAELVAEGLHPFQNEFYGNGRRPTPWARKFWKRFLFTEEDFRRSIRYVEDNPLKEGKRRQSWPFVTPYVQNASLRDSR